MKWLQLFLFLLFSPLLLLLFISSSTKVREVELEPVTIQLRWFHQFQFAGRNELAVQVDVFDTASQALLVSFTAKKEPASHPMSSENDMDDAIREAVDEIILELKR